MAPLRTPRTKFRVADVFPQQEQTIGRVQLRIFGRHQADEKVYSPDPQITIPASGLSKRRNQRPDKRPHSITRQKRSETTCATDGNHRRAVPANADRSNGP